MGIALQGYVYFHFSYRKIPLPVRRNPAGSVKSEISKCRGFPLVHIRMWIYF